ncbi:MAG TPA: hypothetical protein PK874_10025 [Desulfobacteraceae bacterium]|nr:hypothetical protein [Desulfobacteraceae bacterium]HPJ67034.1 hypothetical protein [Desulfobacteraceae bacterium]HPQ27300.1 hypothetical protein [Desulfobacteraceae bacterium]
MLSVILTLVFFFGAKRVGVLQAKYDLWRGQYEIHGYGLILGVPPEVEILNAHGIEYRHVAGCVVNDFIIDSVAEYNSVMSKAIKEDLGVDVDKGWVKKMKRVKSEQSYYKELEEEEYKETDNVTEGPSTILCTPVPEHGKKILYEIGPYFRTFKVNIDGDKALETVGIRALKYRQYDDLDPTFSLVIDIFKSGHRILRQELDRTCYYKEDFVLLRDLDADGKSELVTRVSFGPKCAGECAFRIYKFRGASFDLVLDVFGISLDNPTIKDALTSLPGSRKEVLKLYQENRISDYPLGEDPEELIKSDPWLIDPDHKGDPKMLYLLIPTYDIEVSKDDPYLLFLAISSAKNGFLDFAFHSVEMEFFNTSVDLLGFVATRDQRTHLLLNFVYPGNGGDNSLLRVFNIALARIEKIGEFSGFYEHAIAERLRDIDGDGDTEIIFVKDIYWPPGKAHFDTILKYGVGRYLNGKYVNTNVEFLMPQENN